MASYTEAEAKLKWCPFARIGVHAGHGGVSVNRHPDETVQEEALCLGTGCMAWRWASPELRKFIRAATGEDQREWDKLGEDEQPPTRPDYVPEGYTFQICERDHDAGWVEPEAEAQARRFGCCGMAGKP